MSVRDEMQPLLYERQKGETDRQFHLFTMYRDMGMGRSLREVARKSEKHLTYVGRVSSKNNWVKRVAQYDADMDKKALQENVKKRREMAKRHAKTSMMFQQKIVSRLNSLSPEELTTQDLSRWLEIAVKIERLSLGEATEISDMQHTGKDGGSIEMNTTEEIDLSGLSDEELKNLEQLIGKSANTEPDKE